MSGLDFPTLFGQGAITVILLALVQVFLKLRENRSTLRLGAEVALAQRNADDAAWIHSYRHAAEMHLDYDNEMRGQVSQLRYTVNQLEKGQGLQPTNFGALPKAPPLFPTPAAPNHTEGLVA